ncbi:UNVERIFIED_CONTAM: hypothetical protein GTU68_066247 [Idotea baltica]|nr:hypothetical protein [Idotea baltica]
MGQRIDNFLRTRLKSVPNSHIYRIVRKGELRINKGRVKPDYKLKLGDIIRIPPLKLAERGDSSVLSSNVLEVLEHSIIYEDTKLLILNKPAGMAVHGGSGLSFGVIEGMRQLKPQQDLELVHRLDRDTSGLLMISKKRSMLRFLHQSLREGSIDKRYYALVAGAWPSGKKSVNAPLRKNNLRSGERIVEVDVDGKEALTRFKVKRRFGESATLMEASPVTGRTHQIRVHARHAGHAIAGDKKYGNDVFSQKIRGFGGKRLFLHAHALTIPLPDGDNLSFDAPLDSVWEKVARSLSNKEET